MKRRGFTLAEVLITLGIIGVVAALTAPALVQNANSAKVGPKLAKAVSTFELANEAMLNEASTTTLKGMSFASDAAYLTKLSDYMRMTYDNESGSGVTKYSSLLKNYSGKTVVALSPAGELRPVTVGGKEIAVDYLLPGIVLQPSIAAKTIAMVKGGAILGVNIDANTYRNNLVVDIDGTKEEISFKPHQYPYGTVIIDINGKSEPNQLGKDAFVFTLMADGSLEPYGANGSWNTGKDLCNATTVNSGGTCSASIFENDLKVIYQ